MKTEIKLISQIKNGLTFKDINVGTVFKDKFGNTILKTDAQKINSFESINGVILIDNFGFPECRLCVNQADESVVLIYEKLTIQ